MINQFFRVNLFYIGRKPARRVSPKVEEEVNFAPYQIIAGVADTEAIEAYQEHCEKEGKPQDHPKAKQLLVGLADGLIDKLSETKGLDATDKIKAKKHAEEQLNGYFDDESRY